MKQVDKQVNVQIVEHIPVGLQQQAEESNEQVRDIKTSLTNSYVIIMIIGAAMLDIQENLVNRGLPIRIFRAEIWMSLLPPYWIPKGKRVAFILQT